MRGSSPITGTDKIVFDLVNTGHLRTGGTHLTLFLMGCSYWSAY